MAEIKHKQSSLIVVLTALFAVLCGLYLLIGGVWLVTLGGSWYYPIAGLVMLGVAWLLWRGKQSALWLYAALLLATMLWSIWEVGFDFWALTPRCDILVFFGIWLILPFVWRKLPVISRPALPSMMVTLIITAGILGWAIFNDPQEIDGTLKTDAAAATTTAPAIPDGDWPAYGRNQEGQRFSPLKQINADNVHELKEAWSFQTRDVKLPTDPGEITNEVTPIKVGDTLYLCSAHQRLFALDAATGKEKWHFDPQLNANPSFQHVTCRGVSYHEARADSASPDVVADCPRRIILPVNDGRLFAINADNGKLCESFANKGILNLQTNQPVTTPGMYEPTSPPIVTDKIIVIAGAVTDNYSTREPSGVIRGFDVNTGDLVWAFDPGAKDPNAIPSDEHHFSLNSPNSWAPAAYDAQLDLVYLPMGVTTPDIWGGNRTEEQERYASSIVALNASTGKLAWFYQTVHHDLWDMDMPSQPTLADITDKNGNVVPVIYAPAKTGNIFVLDRRDGKLVVPAPEKPVPQGPAKGDRLSPTQPFSELSFRPTKDLSGADMWGATMFDQLVCRVMFHQLRYEGIFTPPSEQGTLVFPGNLGMFEWGGISVDPSRQVAIANPIALPFVSKLMPRGPDNPMEPPETPHAASGQETGIQPQYGVPYGVTLNPFLSPFGLPCKQPAWGYISALDLKTNEVVWKKRIGTPRDSLPFSLPFPLPFNLGMPMLGGPISTAGNVLFVGATADNYLRAYNMTNGEKLWEGRLPAGGQATPMTYEVNGKQYVVISAGGHGSFGTKMGDYIVAFALPDDAK
ncbi:glucose/quinate/shikimate family membrane-bound PQQ-dependent dehydrogenase [Atlantibacter subterranea]|uniref:Glucose/quinate/shikimate family membrane-bound PQQ-dependent dehydrogenase n=1 Tax=Atlantibacter subterraneus TaxID=255519 RepID=A0A3R9ELC0_9ENTR|nr:glucose/quinate/shikimate family membrane-bound PQQ-dependent dehydrogenase [Atlantibacter subterranea]MDA3131800.1 glucose/quinate/shikimate family membrane-bound PQQ-dependent dehydrogenase [Atlantibacter subterranea]RSB62179.1 glucose/quinate/shikimate family membrane-bound PQQ-dependent dehydrogenase [Atlantibacter subterranea]RSE06922.1 glucose/quinate/shikimate family membrane-bound PQQ-dependent dehydrogenase [Atlantibacter subterranea]RSE26141.1 glucose/quinate/shikimate family membr